MHPQVDEQLVLLSVIALSVMPFSCCIGQVREGDLHWPDTLWQHALGSTSQFSEIVMRLGFPFANWYHCYSARAYAPDADRLT